MTFIDYIFHSAILSSPHTIPIKKKNRQITNYDDHLDETFQRGIGNSACRGEKDLDEYNIVMEHGISKLVLSPSTSTIEE